jgi:uncharacterized protein YggT (Ycf19 family)
MTFIDAILNFVCLLLWVSWRSLSFDPLVKSQPLSLASTLKRTEPPVFSRWHFLTGLGVLLLLRGLLYWQIGPAVNWVPNLKLGAISIFFRSDLPSRIMLFSLLSFLLTLLVFYLCLLLLSLVNGRGADEEPMQRLVKLHLGMVDRWPWPVKLLLPIVGSAALWLAVEPLLAKLGLVEGALSARHALEQATVIGLGAYLPWKYLIGGVLLLWLLVSYVYLGNHTLWNFILLTGRNLLRPLRWLPLQVGKVDFAPLLEVAIVFIAAQLAERGLTLLYARLPI